MKLRLLFSGLLVGIAIGLVLGGVVDNTAPHSSDKRQYTQGFALLLALAGGVAAGMEFRRTNRMSVATREQNHAAGSNLDRNQ